MKLKLNEKLRLSETIKEKPHPETFKIFRVYLVALFIQRLYSIRTALDMPPLTVYTKLNKNGINHVSVCLYGQKFVDT